jgi:hypothetical protein
LLDKPILSRNIQAKENDVSINQSLVNDVKEFLDSGDREFLTTLQMGPRDDIEGQAVVRYLMQLKHWPLTPDSDFAKTLDHLFGEYPERKKIEPETYQVTTEKLILDAFNYQCVEVKPEPKPVVEEKPKKTKKSPKEKAAEEGESGSKTFKPLKDA